jgi:hypothetical protein
MLGLLNVSADATMTSGEMIDDERPDRPRFSGDDPERSLNGAVRCAVLPAVCMPFALASLGASAAGDGLALALAAPLAAVALIANVVCWVKVVVRWRALPRPGDDDHGWPRWWWDGDPPLHPSGGPGGVRFDWTRFERDFWAHVTQQERLHELELVRALVSTRPVSSVRA